MLKLYFLLPVFLFCTFQSYAQQGCSFTIDAGPDTTLCGTGSYQLNGDTALLPGVGTILWQPTSGLSDSASLTPVATVSTTTTYTITVFGNANLIYNGDFSQGDTGFSTMYVPGSGGISGIVSNPGDYDINVNPNNSHIDFATFGDHTTGTGNMMIINGADVPNVDLWCQTVSVTPFTDYDFSVWGTSCNWANPAILRCTINGIQVGIDLNLQADTGNWHQLAATWNSGPNTIAQICIIDVNLWSAGNDFAIDDVSFTGACSLVDSVTVYVVPVNSFSLGNDSTLCAGDSLTLSAPVGFNQYEWFKDNVPIPDTSSSIIVTSPGLYTINAISGNCSVSDTIEIFPGQINFDIGSDTILCSGDTIVLIAPGGFATYQWQLNGNPVTGSGNSLPVSIQGNYSVIIEDSSGCMAVDSLQVNVESVNVSLTGNTSICPGDSLELSAGGNGITFQWFLDNTSLPASSQNITVFQEGEYSVTAFSASGCSATATMTLVIYAAPLVTTSPDTILCNPGSLQLQASGGVSYQWNPALYLDDPASPAPITTPASTILYTVTGTDQNGCSANDEILITVADNPIAEYSFETVSSCEGAIVSFTNNSSGASSYLWDFGDGQFSGEVSPVHNYVNAGSFTVNLVAINGLCTDTATTIISFADLALSNDMHNVFTPDGDGLNDCFTPGVPEELEECISFTVYNRWGNKIFSSGQGKHCWNGRDNNSGSFLPSGTYFYVMTYRDKDFKNAVHLIRE